MAAFRPLCKRVVEVHRPERIPELVQRAVRTAVTGRPGPVALSIPTDLLATPVAGRLTPAGEGRRPPCDVGLLEEAARYLTRARRPLLVAGGGSGGRPPIYCALAPPGSSTAAAASQTEVLVIPIP